MEIDDMLMRCRPGVTIEIDDVRKLSRRTREQIEIMRQIFDLGANVRAPDGELITPDDAKKFLAGMAVRVKAAPKDTGEPWNKATAEERKNALKYWKRDDLSNAQVVELSGFDYSTLFRWFASKHKRNRKPGRPPGSSKG